jgi:hypothetical protein
LGRTNIDKVREAREQIDKSGGGKTPGFKWKEGLNRIRILPPPDTDEVPWREVQICFDVGPNKKVLTPRRQYGLKPDPLSDYLDELGRQKDKASKDELKRIKPSRRFKMMILDRDNEALLAQVADFNVMVIKDVLKFFADPEYGDLSDPEEGRDLKITYTPKEKSKNGFPVFEVVPAAKVTPLQSKAMTEAGIDASELLAENYFEKHRIGYPSSVEYMQAVLEGEDEQFKGTRVTRPDGEPLGSTDEATDDEFDDEEDEKAVKSARNPRHAVNKKPAQDEDEEPEDDGEATEVEDEETAEEEETADEEQEDEEIVTKAKAKVAASAPAKGKSAADAIRAKLKSAK